MHGVRSVLNKLFRLTLFLKPKFGLKLKGECNLEKYMALNECVIKSHILHDSDNPDQIKKMFDDKIRTYVSANSMNIYSHLRIQRERHATIEYAIAINLIHFK